MLEIATLSGSAIGGLGLFLLAIGMMTDGLKLAAGASLRNLLSKWSSTALRGIFTGFLMTAIVQSSSAVTVASLGFVNAGLIKMRQALGIIYGANVGTTMTGWLVAVVGFNVKISAFALPMIGIGMIIKLIAQQGKAASFGWALVGFGLFFVGIDVLKTAFEGVVVAFDISQVTVEGVRGVLTFLLLGVVMTFLTQSSSASIALTITLASSGLVGLYAAGAMVIGANVGTTSTAVLASIGATPNAKRVAAAQVIFNVGTALVALILLPIMFYLVETISVVMEVGSDPAISLALFHTVFNVLGVLLIYPYNKRLAIFLKKRFVTVQEKTSRLRFLDRNIAQTPVLAVNALVLELRSISSLIGQAFNSAVNPQVSQLIVNEKVRAVKSLSTEVAKFIVNIERSTLSEETTQQLATLMNGNQYFANCILSIDFLATKLRHREALQAQNNEQAFLHFFDQTLQAMMALKDTPDGNNEFKKHRAGVHRHYERLKTDLYHAAINVDVTVNQMNDSLDCLSEGWSGYKDFEKGVRQIKVVSSTLNTEESKIKNLREPSQLAKLQED